MSEYTKQERIKENGEVFTPDNIVNDMLDMLEEQQPLDINTTVLEPACGDGQILVRVLWRKLQKVTALPLEQQELGLLKALSSTYGVDISNRNVNLSKTRIKSLTYGYTIDSFSINGTQHLKIENLNSIDLQRLEPVIDFILNNNIILGDALETNELEDLFVYLTDYKWNEDFTVTTHKCPITNLDNKQDEKIIDYRTITITDLIPKQDYKQASEDKSVITKPKASTFGNIGKLKF